ncbi:MAG: CDP-diacylglycerol--glycerol-3-phosphate 3-phosphatidyltransferase [Planctomycetota bacterium]
MRHQVPNALTVLRLILAAAFFLILNQYRYGQPEAHMPWLWLLIAVVLFILAAVTDALDGHLARKWKAESTFGRIMDPFCDKVLVIGALIYLAGPRFVDPDAVAAGSFFNMASGVYPWMVVVVLARELLVTGIRGELEGAGVKFGANVFGKLKMILQSVVVPIVLVIVAIDPARDGWGWLAWVRDVLVYATVAVTVLSGWPYLSSAVRLMRSPQG